MTGPSFPQTFAQGLTEVSDKLKCELGAIRREPGGIYKYVQYTAGTGSVTFAAGDILFYSDYDGNTVTADLTDIEASLAAGVAMAPIAAAASFPKYGWVQIGGEYGPLNSDVVAGAAGNALTAVGAADKKLDVSALVTDPICAILIDATASSQKILCLFPE